MILGSLKAMFSADTSQFRTAVNQSMDLLDKFAGKMQSTAADFKTLGGSGTAGDRFRAPDSGQFIGTAKAMETYHSRIMNLEADLAVLKSGLNTVNAPLRTNAVFTLMAAESAYEASDGMRAMGAAAATIPAPTLESATALANLRANAIAIQSATAPIGLLSRSLRELNLVNFRTTASVEQWDVLGVMRGPGRLVEVFDRLSFHLRGIAPPMRQIQYLTQVLLVPAMMALSNALTTVANNPAASVLSRNLAVIGAQLVDRFSAGKMLLVSRMSSAFSLLGQAMMGNVRSAGALGLSVSGLTYSIGNTLVNAATRGAMALGSLAIQATQSAVATAQGRSTTTVYQFLAQTFERVAGAANRVTQGLNSWMDNLVQSIQQGLSFGKVMGGIQGAVLGLAGAIAGALVSTFAALTGAVVRATAALVQVTIKTLGFLAARAITGIVQGLTQAFVQLGVQALQSVGRMASAAARMLTLGVIGRRAATGVDATSAAMQRATKSAGGFRMGLAMIAPPLAIFTTMGPGVGTALAAIAGAAKGMSFATQTEQLTVAFATMLKSTDQAQKLNAEITAFSATNPFALTELREAGKTLLAFNVSQQQIVPTMKMLGDIAAGTGKPINELAEAYGKMKSRGVADMERLNTFMAAGALNADTFAASMGMTSQALFKAVENKQITFSDVQRGLIAATAAGGKFHGMIDAQGQTVGGLVNQLKDNVNITLASIGEKLFTTFNVPGILRGLIAATGWIRETMVPVVLGAFERVLAFVKPIGVTIFSTVMPYLTAFAEGVQMAFLVVEFVANNWRESLYVAATGAALALVRFGAIAQHTFTIVIPAVLQWFWENWRDIFFTVRDFTMTILINIGKNIRNLFTSLYEWLASGGTKGFEFAFIPLAEGFTNTIRKFPETAAREIGPMESTLAASLDKSSTALKGKFAEFAAGKKIPITAVGPKPIAAVIPDDAGGAGGKDGAGKDKKGKGESELKALEFGSAETFKAAFGKSDDKLYKQGEAAAKQRAEQAKALKEIAKNTKPGQGPEVVPAF